MASTLKLTDLQHPSSGVSAITIGTDNSVSIVGGAISPQTGFKNRIINGGMTIWQRGTTFAAASTGLYTADRWQTTVAGTSLNLTVTQSTSVPSVDYLYSLQFQQVTNAATSVTEYAARQRFELANVRDLAGKIVTVSFWYRSNVVGTHGVRILPLGTTGGVDTSVAITVSAANTWEFKTVTTTALSALTSWGSTADNAVALILDVGLRVNAVGQTTINTNDYFNVTQVQLEKGSTATPFEFRSYGDELNLCYRYFQRYSVSWRPYCENGNFVSCFVPTQTMRVAPTASRSGGSFTSCTFAGLENITTNGFRYTLQGTSTTMVEVLNDVTLLNGEL